MAKNTIIPYFLHGGDYNPEQWYDCADILETDIRLFKKAHINTVTVGMFVWSTMEPSDGVYDFEYMDRLMKTMEQNDIKVVLGTPSGAKPAWLAEKYPEVLRVAGNGHRDRFGLRENHCFTSPVYREKVVQINTRLAERYKDNKALFMWHLSNEYCGECYCDKCIAAFQAWLKEKYNGDIDRLNLCWGARVWNHVFDKWEQIEPPMHGGQVAFPELTLDWKRFVSHQTIDFMKAEMAPLREITPQIPITTNYMGFFPQIDYRAMAKELDIVSNDIYPEWHAPQGDPAIAIESAMIHDLMRSLKHQSFMIMESTPSKVNWRGQSPNRPKQPGMNTLASLQAVAHGADTVQYFQLRQCRHGDERFHGAVISHSGRDDTRVFREATALGEKLNKIGEIVGTETESRVAFLYDWDNLWGVQVTGGFTSAHKDVVEEMRALYKFFAKKGINTDFVGSEEDFSAYKLLVLPYLFLTDTALVEKIRNFVENGGTVLSTYMLGMIDKNGGVHTGGFPCGALKDIFGLWNEETDALYDGEHSYAVFADGKEVPVCNYCEVVHPVAAEVLAVYGDHYYKGMPALLCNTYGKGKAYYMPTRGDEFYETVTQRICSEAGLKNELNAALPDGVFLTSRRNGDTVYAFLQNFTEQPQTVGLPAPFNGTELLSGETMSDGDITLGSYDTKILKFQIK